MIDGSAVAPETVSHDQNDCIGRRDGQVRGRELKGDRTAAPCQRSGRVRSGAVGVALSDAPGLDEQLDDLWVVRGLGEVNSYVS